MKECFNVPVPITRNPSCAWNADFSNDPYSFIFQKIRIHSFLFIQPYFRILACPSGTYNDGKGLNCTGKSFSS